MTNVIWLLVIFEQQAISENSEGILFPLISMLFWQFPGEWNFFQNPYQFVHVEKTDQNFICIVWKGKTFVTFVDISEVLQTPLKDTIIREGDLALSVKPAKGDFPTKKDGSFVYKKRRTRDAKTNETKPLQRNPFKVILIFLIFDSSCYNRKIRTIYFLFGKFFAYPTSYVSSIGTYTLSNIVLYWLKNFLLYKNKLFTGFPQSSCY